MRNVNQLARKKSVLTYQRLWQLARVIALFTTGGFLFAWVLVPEIAVDSFWNVVVPLIPASLLVNPLIWRNVCPFATLNMVTAGLIADAKLSRRASLATGTAGILLLALLIPARIYLLNDNGTALAVTVGALALISLGVGAWFNVKAGFCNSFCPVLPVERLYGSNPLLKLGTHRCATCSACAPACIDLSPVRSPGLAIGRSNSRSWYATPFGAFAAAFPGFVLGYYTVGDIVTSPWQIYFHVGWMALVSFGVAAALITPVQPKPARTVPVLAAAAAGIYYWFVPELMVETLGFGSEMEWIIRFRFLTLVAAWLWNATRNSWGVLSGGVRKDVGRKAGARCGA